MKPMAAFLRGLDLLLAALALPAMLTMAPLAARADEASVARPVVTEITGRGPAESRAIIGTVAARIEGDLGFPVSGTIASRGVDLGERVKKGDVLARLDPEAFEAAVWAARAGVVVASQQLKSAEDALSRARELVKRGVESEARLQDAQTAYKAAKARLEQARAALARAEDLLNSATLSAPHEGIVTGVLADPGESVTAGQPVLRLAGTKAREVLADVGLAELAALPRAGDFTARLLAAPDAVATLRFGHVEPVADRRTRTRRIHFSLVNASPVFRIGALVRILPPPAREGAFTIPTSAILEATEGRGAVWVVERPAGDATAPGKVRRAEITHGPDLGGRVLVLSGLEPGQEIVIRGIHSLREGDIVGPAIGERRDGR